MLSNVDRELLEPVLDALGRPFGLVLTASEIGAYKPDPRCFEALHPGHRERHPDRHPSCCAQSRHHDIAPARASGMRTVWIRRRGRPGAVPPSAAVADFALDSLADLAKALGA
ncbi:MAG: HAD family hydrolase [Xanthomonadales bacterium]|nr:HAD family hydrolase [Xanthomonadales bacterium]